MTLVYDIIKPFLQKKNMTAKITKKLPIPFEKRLARRTSDHYSNAALLVAYTAGATTTGMSRSRILGKVGRETENFDLKLE